LGGGGEGVLVISKVGRRGVIMISKLVMVENDEEFTVMEPLTGTVLCRTIIRQFATDFISGFLETLDNLFNDIVNEFIDCESVPYIIGSNHAVECFIHFKKSSTRIIKNAFL
jgi:hypothetical protein